jgi:nucleoside-diphosphate-sugar epimerase
MKQILVIGANSALARSIIPLLANNYGVITAGRKGCDIYCDISKEFNIPEGVEIVVNCAAAFGGDGDDDIIETEATNVAGILNICVAIRRAGVKHFINISSMSAAHDKTSPYYSIYAIAKKQGDEIAEFYCGLNNIPLTILRPTQIYGSSGQFASHQPFFYHIIDKAQKGEDITIYGQNDALRNYIYNDDIAEIIRRVVDKQVTGTYYCGSADDIKFSQIAEAAQKAFGKSGEIIFLKDKADIPDNVFAKDLTLYEKIDYKPRITLVEGITKIKENREKLA